MVSAFLSLTVLALLGGALASPVDAPSLARHAGQTPAVGGTVSLIRHVRGNGNFV